PSGALFRVHVLEEGLCALNVSSLRTFLALLDIELHFLTFGQRFEAFTSDSTEVYEYVCTAVVLSDETEAFLVVKPLHSTSCFRHRMSPENIGINTPGGVLHANIMDYLWTRM